MKTQEIQSEQLYKVVRVFRNHPAQKVIERNLTEEQAQRLTKSFATTEKSMVVYFKQDSE